jgi:hypothetical protein
MFRNPRDMLTSPSAFAFRYRLSATGLRLLETPPWLGVAVAAIAWVAVVGFAEPFGRLWGTGQEARCYWVPSLLDPYAESTWTNPIAYVYSPAFLQLVSPLTRLPWQAFIAIWTAILVCAVRFLTGPRLLAAGLVFAAMELAGGNISLLLAAAIVLGFRWPAAWAFVLLTKVTPGVGLLWFAARREWRSLAMALGATVAIIACSALFLPAAWPEWVDVLIRNGGREGTWAALPIALWIRLPIAMIVVVWGARTNRRWAVPVASLIALPAVWYGSISMLLAIVALREGGTTDEERDRDSDGALRTRARRSPEPSAAGA